MTKYLSHSFVRYVITGGSAFLLEYTLYIVMVRILGIEYIVASVLLYSILFWLVFILNRKWSFKSKGNIAPQIVKYGILFIFNNVVGNVFLMKFLTENVGLSVFISPIIKMACIVIWNYFIYKHIIYK